MSSSSFGTDSISLGKMSLKPHEWQFKLSRMGFQGLLSLGFASKTQGKVLCQDFALFIEWTRASIGIDFLCESDFWLGRSRNSCRTVAIESCFHDSTHLWLLTVIVSPPNTDIRAYSCRPCICCFESHDRHLRLCSSPSTWPCGMVSSECLWFVICDVAHIESVRTLEMNLISRKHFWECSLLSDVPKVRGRSKCGHTQKHAKERRAHQKSASARAQKGAKGAQKSASA